VRAVHKMWPIATHVTCSICCLYTSMLLIAQMAEPIEMPFGGGLQWAQGTVY